MSLEMNIKNNLMGEKMFLNQVSDLRKNTLKKFDRAINLESINESYTMVRYAILLSHYSVN